MGRLKTSLGIWAFGSMVTRFMPVGYQPQLTNATTAEKVHRAVTGLGDLIDDYEFHYPAELAPDNLDEVRSALDGHAIYAICAGLHLDPRFGRGGLVNPDPATRAEALRLTLEGAEFAGSLGANFVLWPGIEGYNYPFQTPYAESWGWFIDAVGQAAEVCDKHGKKLFLEHKNSEPAMKILMRNIGMTLHVIHKLRAEGITNVQVNMDWQHLIMNGESLGEYAAMLAAEGLLGHQHANSGWGTFDDDNMVGATAFMETLELALELRRANYGASGERLGFDLYPYTEDAVDVVRRSVLQWDFIDAAAGRIDEPALREAQLRKDAIRAYELVYAALGAPGAGMTTVAVGLDVGTTGVKALAVAADGTVVASAEHHYGLSQPQPGWSEQDPADWWTGSEAAIAALGSHEIAGIGLSGQMHGLVALDGQERVLRPAILWNDQRTAAECVEIEQRVGLERLIALTGNRALTGFTAPKLLWLRTHEPEVYAQIHHVLLPKDYVRLRLCGERAIDVADASGTLLFDVAERRFSTAVLEALEVPESWMPRALESPEISGHTAAGIPVAAGAGDCAAAALGVGVERPGPVSLVLGTSGVVFAALPAYQPDAQARVHVFCHAVPGAWHAMGVMLSAAGSLQWARDTFAPGVPFDELSAEAAAAPAGAGGITFLPYLSGERTPHADPDARGALVGLSASHTRGHVFRAVLEGVAFGLADSFDLLRELGVDATVARASGGGARSDFWLRICASVLGVPVSRMAVDEGSAFGAAMLGGVAGGLFAGVDEAVEACVRVRDQIDPEPAWADLYAERREHFKALYPALKSVLG